MKIICTCRRVFKEFKNLLPEYHRGRDKSYAGARTRFIIFFPDTVGYTSEDSSSIRDPLAFYQRCFCALRSPRAFCFWVSFIERFLNTKRPLIIVIETCSYVFWRGPAGFALGQQQADEFQCPEKAGFYPDQLQCDLYYHCTKDGELVEKLCPDGLLFDDSNPSHEKCDTSINVDCGQRTAQREYLPT